jgi:cytochrome c556
MKLFYCAASVLAIVLVAGVVSGPAGAASQSDESPSIKKIMGALHKGQRSPLNTVKAALKSDSPNWAEIQKASKDFETYGAALPKNDPPKGDKASFTKLATAYATNAKAFAESASKQDLSATKAAFGKISGSCTACHKSHRPMN